MEFKGTKGNWIEKWRNSDLVEIRSQDNLSKPICELDSYYFKKRVTGFEELSANAKLIASAPELLEMLTKISLVLENFNPPTKEIALKWSEEINQLIKKATT